MSLSLVVWGGLGFRVGAQGPAWAVGSETGDTLSVSGCKETLPHSRAAGAEDGLEKIQ